MADFLSLWLLGSLRQLLDLLHHRGPGVSCGHREWEDAISGKQSPSGLVSHAVASAGPWPHICHAGPLTELYPIPKNKAFGALLSGGSCSFQVPQLGSWNLYQAGAQKGKLALCFFL